MDKKVIDKDAFIRLIVEKANVKLTAELDAKLESRRKANPNAKIKVRTRGRFMIKDIKKIWGAIEEIFEDCVREEVEIKIRGFLNLGYSETKQREGFGYKKGERKNYELSKRIIISPSKTLKNILKGKVRINKKELKKRRELIERGLESLK